MPDVRYISNSGAKTNILTLELRAIAAVEVATPSRAIRVLSRVELPAGYAEILR